MGYNKSMITIRPAGRDDIRALKNLNEELFIDNQQYDPDLVIDWSQSEKGKTYFSNLLSKQEACCFIAEEDGKPIGYIAASPKHVDHRKSTYIEINNMGVTPEYRSKGVGTILINECLQWTKSHGFQKAFVSSYFNNRKAIDFYKRNGFLEIDIGLERYV